MKLLGVVSVATIIIVFALMAGCRKPEAEPFFRDTTMLMGSHQNKHLECLGEIYGFARLLVKMERTDHPVFAKPDAYYLACMRARGWCSDRIKHLTGRAKGLYFESCKPIKV